MGFPCGSVEKNLPAMQETGFCPWVQKISWRRATCSGILSWEIHSGALRVGYNLETKTNKITNLKKNVIKKTAWILNSQNSEGFYIYMKIKTRSFYFRFSNGKCLKASIELYSFAKAIFDIIKWFVLISTKETVSNFKLLLV